MCGGVQGRDVLLEERQRCLHYNIGRILPSASTVFETKSMFLFINYDSNFHVIYVLFCSIQTVLTCYRQMLGDFLICYTNSVDPHDRLRYFFENGSVSCIIFVILCLHFITLLTFLSFNQKQNATVLSHHTKLPIAFTGFLQAQILSAGAIELIQMVTVVKCMLPFAA